MNCLLPQRLEYNDLFRAVGTDLTRRRRDRNDPRSVRQVVKSAFLGTIHELFNAAILFAICIRSTYR